MRLALVAFVAACGGSSDPDQPATPDAPEDPGPAGCPRTVAPEDRDRFVVVSHPYTADSMPSGAFEVLDLSLAGELTRPGRTFEMGRAVIGTITFTPDGEVGIAALDNGKLGVFTLAADGTPTVVHTEFAGEFYADRVIVEPRGDRLRVLDGNTPENGGGVYRLTIGCDGTLTDHGQLLSARTPGGAAVIGSRLLVATGDGIKIVDLSTTPPSVMADETAFADQPIIGGSALNHDGTAYLVGDVSQFSAAANGVAIVEVDSAQSELSLRIVVPVEDPEAIATSPFGNVAVVASAFGDAIFVLDDQGPDGWRVRGEVDYAGAGPQLPGDVTSIERGLLRGHVLVSENVSVRHLVFGSDGSVTDLGSLAFGSGVENIGGAIGVTP